MRQLVSAPQDHCTPNLATGRTQTVNVKNPFTQLLSTVTASQLLDGIDSFPLIHNKHVNVPLFVDTINSISFEPFVASELPNGRETLVPVIPSTNCSDKPSRELSELLVVSPSNNLPCQLRDYSIQNTSHNLPILVGGPENRVPQIKKCDERHNTDLNQFERNSNILANGSSVAPLFCGNVPPWERYYQHRKMVDSERHFNQYKSAYNTFQNSPILFSGSNLSHDEFVSEIITGTSNTLLLSKQNKTEQKILTPIELHEESTLRGSLPSLTNQYKAKCLAHNLRQLGNKKLNQSEFLKFVESCGDGSIAIRENAVVDKENNLVDWCSSKYSQIENPHGNLLIDHLKNVWGEALTEGLVTEKEARMFDELLNKSFFTNDDTLPFNPILSPTIETSISMTPQINSSNMEDKYDLNKKDREHAECFYKYKTNNVYMQNTLSSEKPLDLMRLASKLITEGSSTEAMLVLEAEVQLNPQSSEGWRLLGQLHADNEQDAKAIFCYKQGHVVDPFNLGTLLGLGVSLGNELETLETLMNLKTWLAYNDKYASLEEKAEVTKKANPLLTATNNSKELITNVIELFEKASSIDPEDLDVRIALGVLGNLSGNYHSALKHLITALRLCSPETASSIWNKIGATLANGGVSKAAILAYAQALALRPHYTRAWANLGIAHANLGLMEAAMKYYLSVLKLNPDADYVWNHVRTALHYLGRHDLFEEIEKKNIQRFTRLFSVPLINNGRLSDLTEINTNQVDTVLSEINSIWQTTINTEESLI